MFIGLKPQCVVTVRRDGRISTGAAEAAGSGLSEPTTMFVPAVPSIPRTWLSLLEKAMLDSHCLSARYYIDLVALQSPFNTLFNQQTRIT